MDFFNSLVLNKKNLISNVELIKKRANGKKICAMVKANAYGHSIKFVVNSLKNYIDFFGVANCVEAFTVREYTLKKILICGKYNLDKLEEIIKKDISISISSLEEVENIIKACKKLNKRAYLHIKINTGMNRLGIGKISIFNKLLSKIEKNDYLILEGIFSHLFCAENESLSKMQYYKFIEYLNALNKFYENKNPNKIKELHIHLENSTGLFKNIDFLSVCSMVRIGIALYGLEIEKEGLKPVLSLKSKVVAVQKCKLGDYVGYGRKILEENCKLAIIPIGYADGILKEYEECEIKVRNKFCKILSICMDMLIIKVQNDVKIGDEVIVISDNEEDKNSINNLAKKQKTISYQLATNLKHNRLNLE